MSYMDLKIAKKISKAFKLKDVQPTVLDIVEANDALAKLNNPGLYLTGRFVLTDRFQVAAFDIALEDTFGQGVLSFASERDVNRHYIVTIALKPKFRLPSTQK